MRRFLSYQDKSSLRTIDTCLKPRTDKRGEGGGERERVGREERGGAREGGGEKGEMQQHKNMCTDTRKIEATIRADRERGEPKRLTSERILYTHAHLRLEREMGTWPNDLVGRLVHT